MQTAYLTVPGGLRVKVRVLAKKLAYGRTLWQVTPADGTGAIWVTGDRLVFNGDPNEWLFQGNDLGVVTIA